MPRRDEEKRIAFLRSLSVEDLANRRITEFSSETEKKMIHQARDVMKERNDARYLRRHQKKASVDVVKTQTNQVLRRGQNEMFGREGGLTGGMIGSWIAGGTLAGGTIVGIASRGKFGALGKAAGKFKSGTRVKIDDLRNFYKQGIITDKHSDKVAKLIRKHKAGQAKDFDYDQLDWLHKRYQGRNNLFSGTPKGGSNPNAPQQIPANTPTKKTSKLTEEEKQILREHRAKIRGGQMADGRPQTAAEGLPSATASAASPPTPLPSAVCRLQTQQEALTKLRTVRGGGATLRIERGNADALDQLAKDIANVSDQYAADPKQQYEIMEALARKAAQQNTKGTPNKLDEFFHDLYGRVIDVKKK